MRNKNYFLLFIGMLFASVTFAQVTVKGTVTDKEDNSPLPGVTVVIQNTTKGTVTDINGKYELQIDSLGQTLEFKFVGMQTIAMVATSSTLNAGMSAGVELDAMVVTALGISKEKKALGYATQEIKGEDMNNVKYDNVVNSMSGRVAGAQVKQSGNFGGSTNIVLRGTTSMNGNNQALFVVDGVPIDNANVNSTYQQRGGAGYDYGNAVADINPDDIESMNVLKGAAATALYGERAANGVIMITTKSGAGSGKKGVGVTFSSNATFGFVDKSTFPKYQSGYGAGYGQYYSGADGSDTAGQGGTKAGLEYYDFDGNGSSDYVTPFTEDASYGQAFDGSPVFQWDALIPESDNYNKATPWESAGDNGAISFFNVAQSYTNSLSLQGGNEKTTFRLSYRNLNQKGILPNSKLVRNNISINATHKATDKLTVAVNANYVTSSATGRNSSGYSGNILSSYRQWWQTNVDVTDLKSLYEKTGRNVTWNPNYSYGSGSTNPIFWDNPYWTRQENYQNDTRDRIFGNITTSYAFTDKLSAMFRVTVDNYSLLREERKAVGSIANPFGVPAAGTTSPADQTSGYYRSDRRFNENNIDLILTYKTDINKDFNLSLMGGTNYRQNKMTEISASTNGGLIVPELYALTNAPGQTNSELEQEIAVSSVYASATLGYKSYLFLDVAMRNDWSSTLAPANNSYFYPAVSGSFIFSEIVDIKSVSFGKVRVNWAQVGKGATWGVAGNTPYSLPPAFTSSLASSNRAQYNPALKPERTTSLEAGLEMWFLNRKLGFDMAYYKTNSKDQIIAVPVSYATGYSSKWLNAGELQNQGVEISLMGKVMEKKDFNWDVIINWSKNVNKVVSLDKGIENLELASFQGGVSVNAKVGESYGAIFGTDYVYAPDGSKIVGSNGRYEKSSSNAEVIGNITPDFNAGMTNTFTYKNWGMSFLLDWQKGGDIFSLDQWYGQATGVYEESVYTNDLGNPVRNSIADGGGFIQEGVQRELDAAGNETGNFIPNTVRIAGDNYLAAGYAYNPNKSVIYDASYLKLREVAIHYHFPKSMLKKIFIDNATFSIVGSNLWIIHKNLPHADPEAGLSSGNVQGFQSGVLPTTRNVGFNLKLNF
jgi:TonB-linked SusC/RagA family outer membrane protein